MRTHILLEKSIKERLRMKLAKQIQNFQLKPLLIHFVFVYFVTKNFQE